MLGNSWLHNLEQGVEGGGERNKEVPGETYENPKSIKTHVGTY